MLGHINWQVGMSPKIVKMVKITIAFQNVYQNSTYTQKYF